MTKKTLLKLANQKLAKLPSEKIMEVMDFAEFLLSKTESAFQNDALLKMAATSKAFAFVNEDEVEYTLSDVRKNK